MRRGLHRRGFSYVEILVATVVLALCAVPLADAVKNGIDASRIGSAKAQELRCLKNRMETVLAEPYQDLWNAARGRDVASSYSQPADAGCSIAREVYIARYEHEYGKAPRFLDDSAAPDRLELALLHITVSTPGGYAFTTLVAR